MADFDFPNDDPLNGPSGQPPKPKSSGWSCLGCLFAIFVGGVLMVVAGLGLGYYVLFHTSFPLRQIEALLESDPDFRVEGLTGSISSGFHVDELHFTDDAGHEQQLEQIDFEFNGLLDLMSEGRLVIDRFTIGGGRLHVAPGDDGADPPDRDRVDDGGAGQPGDGGGLKEVRIGLVQFQNLTLYNDETGFECEIREVSFRDFHYLDGRLQNLGDVVVDADHLELTVESSDHFADAPPGSFGRRIEGVVDETMHEMVLEDLPFEVELLVVEDGRTTVEARLWDGALLVDLEPEGGQRTTFDDFGYERYLAWDHGLLPTAVTGVMTGTDEESGDEVMEIEPGASFALGRTTFAVTSQRLVKERGAEFGPPVVATSVVDRPEGDAGENPVVECRVHSLEEKPYLVVELLRGEERNTRALFAETVHGKPFADLDASQQARIDATIEATKAVADVEGVDAVPNQ